MPCGTSDAKHPFVTRKPRLNGWGWRSATQAPNLADLVDRRLTRTIPAATPSSASTHCSVSGSPSSTMPNTSANTGFFRTCVRVKFRLFINTLEEEFWLFLARTSMATASRQRDFVLIHPAMK
jgi:hypothetical protein